MQPSRGPFGAETSDAVCRVMKTRLLRHVFTLALLMGMLAPAISEIFCSENCSGGVCEVIETESICDLDATSACCSEEPADASRSPIWDADAFLLVSECRPCPCFTDDVLTGFTITEKARTIRPLTIQTLSFSFIVDAIPAGGRAIHRCPTGTSVHGPPPYLAGHSFLI